MTVVAMVGDGDRNHAAMRALIVEALRIADDRADHLLAAMLAGCLDMLDRRDSDD